jgi:hypothetical protein
LNLVKSQEESVDQMLNLKEVTQQLRKEGITDSEQVVKKWIREGKIKATRTTNIKIDYLINPDDLARFILKTKLEKERDPVGEANQQWEVMFHENQKLKEEIEELKSMLRIEQAKVRSLKKMLKAEYALTHPAPLPFHTLFGLDAAAEKETVKKEFKKLLKALHPDRGGDERLFKVFYEQYKMIK